MRPACIVLVLAATACRSDAPPAQRDSTAPGIIDSAAAAESASVRTGWDDRAGPVLLVAGETPDEALVVFPQLQGDEAPEPLDAADYTGSEASLIARRGSVASITLGSAGRALEEGACAPWPRLSAPDSTPSWTVGFLTSGITAIPADSIGALAPRDSATFVASIARVASTLSGARGRAAAGGPTDARSFNGLPFAVKDVARFTDGTTQVAVAHVVRRVNQEATPLEEHSLLVLERPATGGSWTVAYDAQSVGREETVDRSELLGVVRLGGRATLVMAQDGGAGVAYSLVQRTASGRWVTIWRSARPSC